MYRMLETQKIKAYGKQVCLEDGTVLHENYSDEDRLDGRRTLVRCTECGALMICQYTCEYDFYDGPDSLSSYIPVASEEEADLMNILLDETEMFRYPYRHLSRHNWNYGWSKAPEPRPNDPEELRKAIRDKYAHVNQELLEKIIQEAGQAAVSDKTPFPEPKPEPEPEEQNKEQKPETSEEDKYSYMVRRNVYPPILIRLGDMRDMTAEKFVYPGVWEDTPHLNDIRFGMGSFMDYDDITIEEAEKIMKQNLKEYKKKMPKKKKS